MYYSLEKDNKIVKEKNRNIILFFVIFILVGIISVCIKNILMGQGKSLIEKLLLGSCSQFICVLLFIVPAAVFFKVDLRNSGINSLNGIKKGLKYVFPVAIVESIPAILACNVVEVHSFKFAGVAMVGCVALFAFSIAVLEELSIIGIALHFLIEKYANRNNAKLKAIIISSLLFTVLHIRYSEFSVYMILYNILFCSWIFIFRMFASSIFFYSGNIWCAIIMHAIVDFFANFRFICLPNGAYPYVNAARGMINLFGLEPLKQYELAGMIIYLLFAIPEVVLAVYLLKRQINIGEEYAEK